MANPSGAFGAFGAFGTSGAFGAFGSSGAFGAFGAFGAPSEDPALASALINSRDGITGARLDNIGHVVAAPPDTPEILKRLAPSVRAAIYQAELGPTVDVGFDWHNDAPRATVLSNAVKAGKKHNFIKQTAMVSLIPPTSDQLRTQMKQVWGYAQIRQDRAPEILTQMATPIPFFSAVGFIDPDRTPYTIELLGASLAFAATTYQRAKYTLSVKRPIEYSPQIQPMIPTPTHGSLPSGHATEAFVIARIIWKLLKQSGAPQYCETGHWGEMLMRLASRIAVNRTVAGVHYPVDSVAGAVLGLTLADHIAGQCLGRDCWQATFDGRYFDPDSDFHWHTLYEPGDEKQKKKARSDLGTWMTGKSAKGPEKASAVLAWLWSKAVAEWEDIGSANLAAHR